MQPTQSRRTNRSRISEPPLINFFVNSNFAQHSFIAQAADGQWRVNWDTTFLTNGNYQVQLACQVAPLGSPDSIINIFGATKTVQVSNPIVFDSLTSQFTDAMFIYGLLAVTNSTYDVNLFDEDGSPLVHATGLSAQNGQIALYWDLTDGNGNQISFGNIQAVFTIHPPANPLGIQPRTPQSPTQTSRWFLKDAANTGGAFTVAWGWDSYSTSFNNKREGLMADGVINVLGNPADPNSYNLLPVANIPYGGSSFRYDSASDKTILMHALTASGNFFWMGHGNDRVIMGNEKISGLGFADIVALLGNTAFMSSPKKPRTNKHPYHLVILNACETYSDLWANAFGIDFSASGSHDTAADYDLVHRPKRAFVGWTKSVFLPNSFDTSGLKHAQYASALETLFGYWMAGYPLEYCMQYYTISATSNGFTGADSWKISGCVGVQRN